MNTEERTATTIAETAWSRFLVLLFFGILIIGGTCSFILPKPDISDIENRPLERLPAFSVGSLLTGAYTDSFSIYYSDTFPMREKMITTAYVIKSFRGLVDKDHVSIYPGAGTVNDGDNVSGAGEFAADGSMSGANVGATTGSAFTDGDPIADPGFGGIDQIASAITKPVLAEVPDREGNLRGAVLVVGDTALELYSFVASANDRYAAAVNAFDARHAGSVKTNVLIAPTSVEFMLPPRYSGLSSSQFDSILYTYDQLNPDINKLWVYDGIAKHIEDYLYFRTDHHWTALGAYYGYCEFSKANGFPVRPISAFETVQLDGFLGSLYRSIGGNAEMRANPDYVLTYKPTRPYEYIGYETGDPDHPIPLKLGYEPSEIPGSNKYLACAGGDVAYAKIKSDNHNGRKLIVF
ncbi:MAG: hypothetical protein LBN36_02655, partial [Clostridiales Family XIII bacterium]|nr:hypothetical protein [Clostridiales Family XIII bacterium]